MTKDKKFTIITEDGKKFCEGFFNENGEAVYKSKEGKIRMSSLMEQTYGTTPHSGRQGRRAS